MTLTEFRIKWGVVGASLLIAEAANRLGSPLSEGLRELSNDLQSALEKIAGEDIERTHHLPKDAEYLLELPPYVRHFDILVNG
jgi:hypothetical protein